jgi:N-dimethylarginine dimethylaminohydrolase
VSSTSSVHSYDEFTSLREVVVGTARNARIPGNSDISMWLNLFGDLRRSEVDSVRTGKFPERVIEETEEDLAALVETLRGFGIIVHRPKQVLHDGEFTTPHWRSNGFYSYCPRDLAVVVGSAIIETPSPMRARYFETLGLRPIFQQCLLRGSPWIAAPKPELRDDLYTVNDQGLPTLGEVEPAFEAANILRCGRDLFYQVSTSGNELGGVWLETVLRAYGDFTVHRLRGLYEYTHIDSTITLLRPGLALVNPERVDRHNIPPALSNWDILWCPPMEDPGPASRHPLSSPWIGMNLLMIDPDLAVVDASQTALLRVLESWGITTLPHRLRHARTMGGGFHCVTLDLVRDGELTSYCDG